MKKLLLLSIILVMMLSLMGCVVLVVGEDEPAEAAPVAPTPAVEKPVAEEPAVEEKQVENTKNYLEFDPLKDVVPGVLYQLNPEEGKEPVIKGVALAGNQAGTEVNERAPSVDNIRFVFERSEWITVVVDSNLGNDDLSSYFEDGLWGFIVPHENNPASLDAAWFETAMDQPVPNSPIIRSDDGEFRWDTYVWEPFEPGFYDLLFTYRAKPVAMVVMRIYGEGMLSDISNEQLEKFMKEATTEAKQL